ncbi:hypothetical protein G2W53_008501 [Senna tora]|uniref:Uncharacterized protein n=1 Tax=Senna tora TaxID=362788 RepID=A0A834X9L4_9FABA|nr:hypothetical protein G2W53_008501 [Senna tora]
MLEELREINGSGRVLDPLEPVDQLGHPERDRHEAQVLPGAHPPTRPERREPQIRTPHVHVGSPFALHEPLGPELQRGIPYPRVVRDGPHVHHRRRVGGNHHPVAEVDVRRGQPGPREEWARGVYPQRLLHHRFNHIVFLKLIFTIERKQNIDEIVVIREVSGFGGSVFLNDGCNEFPHARDEFRAALVYTMRVINFTEPGDIIGPVKRTQELETFSNHIPELVQLVALHRRLIPLAEDATHDVVKSRGLELASGFVRYNPPGGEQVGRGDSPEETPVGAVGSEADGSAEHEALSRLFERAVGEMRGGEDLTRGGGVGGDDERGGEAESESHEVVSGGTSPSQGSQGAVSQAAGEGEKSNEEEGEKDGKEESVGVLRKSSSIMSVITNKDLGSKKSWECENPPVRGL